jgi:hypothetical protein
MAIDIKIFFLLEPKEENPEPNKSRSKRKFREIRGPSMRWNEIELGNHLFLWFIRHSPPSVDRCIKGEKQGVRDGREKGE